GSTQIVVTAAAGAPGIGNVAVYSASTGTTVKSNGFTYLKTDQTISFPNLGKQEVTNTIGLSATATSLLDVSFSVASGPAELSGGTNLSFTGAGHVVLLADQAGDGNWNAAPTVTNAFDVIGVITNVTPASGTRYTEHEVTISGLWLGSGTDITNVMLCDVSAVIITQGIHSVTVMAGLSPVATNGDVFVQSAGFGTVVLTNGFSYLPVPPPPVALSAVDITADRFTARWTAAESATNYLIDVSETNAFTTFTGIYSNWSFGDVTAGLVTGLTDGVTYYYRVRAANSYGSSLDSNIIEVPVSTNTPYILYEVTNGVASAGSSDVIDLTKLFYGSGMSYSIISNSNPSLVTATLNGSELILSYAASVTGSADITVRTTDLSNGFYVDNTITVHVVPEPGENIGAITLNPQTGLFEQTITVSNTSPTLAARAVTLTVTNLTSGAELYNATGTDEHGNPEILWIGTLDPLTAMDFTLQYYTATRGTAPTGTVIVSLSLESPQTAVSGTAFNLSGTPQNISGTQSFLIEFGATPGRTYYIQYTDALSNPWKTVQPPIVAPVNRIQWIDSGPPGTESAPGAVSNRFYRILEKTQN
ncbi:MAG: IPT/TIG domain-containing protein, partial [Kiritimatiellales bacterium]